MDDPRPVEREVDARVRDKEPAEDERGYVSASHSTTNLDAQEQEKELDQDGCEVLDNKVSELVVPARPFGEPASQ